MSNGFEEKVNTQVPWWAKAPVWLAAGIVGVPSLMAIGAGYFIASNVTKHLQEIKVTNQTEIAILQEIKANQATYWEMVRRTMAVNTEIQLRTCIHQAESKEQRDDCMRGMASVK